MALLEQINRVINQLESQGERSDECASDSTDSTEQVEQLINLLFEELETQEDSPGQLPLNATEEIDHLVSLLVEQLDNPSDSSDDRGCRQNETDRLVDLLLDLIKTSQNSDRKSAELANNESSNSLLDQMPSGSKYSAEAKAEEVSQNYCTEDLSKIFESVQQSVKPPSPEKMPEAVTPPTADRLAEELLKAVNQPKPESIESIPERSPQQSVKPPSPEKMPEAVTPPTADQLAEQLLKAVNQPKPESIESIPERSPQKSEEPHSEPDPEEVARSLDYLRQLMFPNQSPQSSQTQAANPEHDLGTESDPEANLPTDADILDEVSSTEEVANSSESPEVQTSDISKVTLDRLMGEYIDNSIDKSDVQLIDESEPPLKDQHDFSAPHPQTPPDPEAIDLGQQSDVVEIEVLKSSDEPIIENKEVEVLEPLSEPTQKLGQQTETVNSKELDFFEPLWKDNNDIQNQSDFDLLQNLLVNPEVNPLRELNRKLDAKLSDIDQQINDPKRLISLLMPVIAELLNLKVEESKEDIAQAIAPIIDQAIHQRSQQNKKAMSAVFATLIPEAISYQIKHSPEEIAKAIAPEIAPAIREQIKLDRAAIANVLAPQMGDAIKEQIKLEQESMVDALYPVIGSTVAKYIAEAIRDINEKIAKALSGEGLSRKIRAKIHGVSEGELILKESISSIVQGVFLIHKQSGLIISEAKPPDAQQLESEMVAGMLTAIRSFVNDCIVQSGEVAELDDIEYGLSTIKLEVAGYCYLAVLIKGGAPPKQFVAEIRKTLSQIVLYYSQPIQEFDGDPERIPPKVHELIEELVKTSDPHHQKTQIPLLQLLAIAAAGLICVPLGWNTYKSSLENRQEHQVLTALDSNPELAIYSFNVQVDEDTVTLQGKLPNHRLRSLAEKIVKNTIPNLTLNNQIVAVEIPTDPVLVEKEVKRITETLNQMAGISISAKYVEGKVTIEGIVIQATDSQNIAQAFAQIPGVNSVVSAVQMQPLSIDTRIYFEQNSSKIKPEDVNTKLLEIKRFLTQYPEVHLNIVGHSDRTGKRPSNQNLALNRAETIEKALISLGLSPERLHSSANPEPPIDVDKNQPEWKQRCVIFYPIIPHNNEP